MSKKKKKIISNDGTKLLPSTKSGDGKPYKLKYIVTKIPVFSNLVKMCLAVLYLSVLTVMPTVFSQRPDNTV